MSTSAKPSSQDDLLAETFGAPVAALHERAAVSPGVPALARALELRSFLAQPQITTTLPPATAAPVPPRAGAAREHRP
ncbi:hypothetical protein [Streptomyces niveus]|uniref:hypothetical protein n=1 Tax=Streptomyces niveus TaxID=193462 RepID=UPI0034212497